MLGYNDDWFDYVDAVLSALVILMLIATPCVLLFGVK